MSNEALERTSEFPSLVHVMTGSGLPDLLQNNAVLFPSNTVVFAALISTDGATAN